MISFSRRLFALAPLASLLLPAACSAVPSPAPDAETAQTKAGAQAPAEKKAGDAEKPAEPPAPCEEPEPEDAELAAGLDLYLEGRWRPAAKKLQSWATSEEAAKDPAAGRGFYSLGYALQATGRRAQARQWFEKARPLLTERAQAEPSLETAYYLASLHRTLGDAQAQLELVARTLRQLDEGTLCPNPDGDDEFRRARLLDFAGREEKETEALRAAVEKFDAGRGEVKAYQAIAHHELALRAREMGQAEDWLRHARAAAELDPSVPGVHRQVGLALLALDRPEEAASYWREHWKLERSGGNSLVYAVRVLQDVARYRERFGDEHRVTDLDEHTTAALEQNAIFEAKRMLQAKQQLAAAETEAAADEATDEASEESVAKTRATYEQADYRMGQFLMEYVARGKDLQEFALQNGLLPAIHGRGLPQLGR